MAVLQQALEGYVKKAVGFLGIQPNEGTEAPPEWDGGTVSYKDARLGSDVFDKLQLPLTVQQSHIGRLDITLPGVDTNFTIRLSDLYIIVGPKQDDFDLDVDAAKPIAVANRRKQLEDFTKKILFPENGGETGMAAMMKESSKKFMTKKAIQYFVSNLQIEVQGLHVRYEDPVTNPRFAFSGGLVVRQFMLTDAVAESEDEESANFQKGIDVATSIYWQSYEAEMYSNVFGWKRHMARRINEDPDSLDNDGPVWPGHQVLPLTQLSLQLESPCKQTGALFGLSMVSQKIMLYITQTMISDIAMVHEFVTTWTEFCRQHHECVWRFKPFRPTTSVLSRPRDWWKHAYRCVQMVRQDLNPKKYWLTKTIERRLRWHRAYLDLVKQQINFFRQQAEDPKNQDLKLDPAVESSLEQFEGQMPIGLLILWRKQALGHHSIPESDLKTLKVTNRVEPPKGGAQASKGIWGYMPVMTGKPAPMFAVSLNMAKLGITLQESAAPHPLRRVPFEIVSHKAYANNYQSADWPQAHQVIGTPNGRTGIAGSDDRSASWFAHLTSLWRSRGSPAWSYLSTGQPAIRGPAGGKGTKVFEVAFANLVVNANQTAEKLTTVDVVLGGVHLGQPDTELPVGNSFVSSQAGENSKQLLHVHMVQDPSKQQRTTKLAVGDVTVTLNSSVVDDLLFFLSDVVLKRPGTEIYRSQIASFLPVLPSCAFHKTSKGTVGQEIKQETSVSLQCLTIGFNAPEKGSLHVNEDVRPHRTALVMVELKNVELQNAFDPAKKKSEDDPKVHNKDGLTNGTSDSGKMDLPHTSWLHLSEMRVLIGTAEARGELALDLRTFNESLVIAHGSIEMEVQKPDAKHRAPTLHPRMSYAQVRIPWFNINLPDAEHFAAMHRIMNAVMSGVPRAPIRCICAGRMKLWFPPTLPGARLRGTMTKVGKDPSPEDEYQLDGQWSCDIWTEFLEDGTIEVYGHPKHFAPTYVLKPLELRESTSHLEPVMHTASRELEVRVANDKADKVTRSVSSTGSMVATPSRQNSTWVYLRCSDTMSRYWGTAYEMLTKLPPGKKLGKLPHPKEHNVRIHPIPWSVRCSIQKGKIVLQQPFQAAIEIRWQGFRYELEGVHWQFRCSVQDVLVEDLGYGHSDPQRFVLSAGTAPAAKKHGSSNGVAANKEFFAVSVQVDRGGYLALKPIICFLSPLLLRRVTDSMRGLFHFKKGLASHPSVAHYFEPDLDLPDSMFQLSREFSKVSQGVTNIKKLTEQAFEFTVGIPCIDFNLLQSYTGLPVVSGKLDSYEVNFVVRPYRNFSLESASLSIGSLRMKGASNMPFFECPDPDSKLESGMPYFRVEGCREFAENQKKLLFGLGGFQKPTAPKVDAWSVEAATGSPWRITYRHNDIKRLKECVFDFFCAKSWARSIFWTKAAELRAKEWERDMIVKANCGIHLPTIHIPNAAGSTFFSCELGDMRIVSTLQKDYNFGQPPGALTRKFLTSAAPITPAPASLFEVTITDSMVMSVQQKTGSQKKRVLASGSNFKVSIGIEASLDGGALKNARKMVVVVQQPKPLKIIWPCIVVDVVASNIGAPSLVPPVVGIVRQNVEKRKNIIAKIIAARLESSEWDVYVCADAAGGHLDILDPKEQVFLQAGLEKLTFQDHKLPNSWSDEFHFSLDTVFVKQKVNLTNQFFDDVFCLKRPAGVNRDVEITLKELAPHETLVAVSMGSPQIQVNPILVAYFRHLFGCAAPAAGTAVAGMKMVTDTSRLQLTRRRAQGMARLYRRAVLSSALPVDEVRLAPLAKATDFARGKKAPPKKNQFGSVTFEIDSVEPWMVKFTCPVSSSSIVLSSQPNITVTQRGNGEGELELRVKMDLQQCQVTVWETASLSLPLVFPFHVFSDFRHCQKSEEVKGKFSISEKKHAERHVLLNIDEMMVDLNCSYLSIFQELAAFIGPPKPTDSKQALVKPGAADAMVLKTGKPRGRRALQYPGVIPATEPNEDVNEISCFFGGLVFTFKDDEQLLCRPIYRASIKPFEIQSSLGPNGGPPQKPDPVNGSVRLKVILELEAFALNAQVWEPLLEPCALAIRIIPGPFPRQVVTVRCEQFQMCVTASQIRNGKSVAAELQNRLAVSQRRNHCFQMAMWWKAVPDLKGDGKGQPNMQQPMPLALDDLVWSKTAWKTALAQANIVFEEPEANSDQKLLIADNIKPEGLLLSVSNHTGLEMTIKFPKGQTFSFQPRETKFLPSSDLISPGFEMVDVSLKTAQGGNDIIVKDIPMTVADRASRSFVTELSNAVLVQEVQSGPADRLYVCFRSGLVFDNLTSAEVDISIRSGSSGSDQAYKRVPAGERLGFPLDLENRMTHINFRPVLSDKSQFCEPIEIAPGDFLFVEEPGGEGWRAIAKIQEEVLQCAGSSTPNKTMKTITLHPSISVFNDLPMPVRVCLSDKFWHPQIADQAPPSILVPPNQSVGTMSISTRSTCVWISIAEAVKDNFFIPQKVLISTEADPKQKNCGSAVVSLTTDMNSFWQVDVQALRENHESPGSQKVTLALTTKFQMISQCPFPLLLWTRPMDLKGHEDFAVVTPVNLYGPQSCYWLFQGKTLGISGLGAEKPTGPDCEIPNVADVKAAGQELRAGDYDLVVSNRGALHQRFSSALLLSIAPRFKILNYTDCDIEVKQQSASPETATVVNAARTSVFHFDKTEEAHILVFRLRNPTMKSSDGVWSGGVDVLKAECCTLALLSSEKDVCGLIRVATEREKTTGGFLVLITWADIPDFHIENHTDEALNIRQAGQNAVDRIGAFTAVPFCWPDPAAAARAAADGRPKALELQFTRWGANEWVTLDPRQLDRCSANFQGDLMYVRIRAQGGVHVIAVSTDVQAEPSPHGPFTTWRGGAEEGVNLPPVVRGPPEEDPPASSHFRFLCASFLVSIVGKQEEDFRISASGLSIGEDRSRWGRQVIAEIGALQINNLRPRALLPNVVHSVTKQPFLHVILGQRLRDPETQLDSLAVVLAEQVALESIPTQFVEHLEIQIGKPKLALYVQHLLTSAASLLDAAQDPTPSSGEDGFIVGAWKDSANPRFKVCSKLSTIIKKALSPKKAMPKPKPYIHIQRLRLSPVLLELTFTLRELDRSSHLLKNPTVTKLLPLMVVTDLNAVGIYLEELIADEVAGLLPDVQKLIKSHYAHQALRKGVELTFSIDALADVHGLLGHVTLGLKDFITIPLETMQTEMGPSLACVSTADVDTKSKEKENTTIAPPAIVLVGSIGRGTVSLLRHVVQGAGTSVARFTQFFSRGAALMTLDDEFIEGVQRSSYEQKPQRVGQGLQQGTEAFGRGMVGGVLGMQVALCPGPGMRPGEAAPASAAKKTSFATNFGKAMLGLVFKPVAGILEAASKVSEGVSAGAKASGEELLDGEDQVAEKPPRMLYGGHRVARKYNLQDAHIRLILDTLSPLVPPGCTYEDHIVPVGPDQKHVVILSDLMVIHGCAAPCRVEALYSLQEIPVDSVKTSKDRILFTSESKQVEFVAASARVAERFVNRMRECARDSQTKINPSSRL